MCDVVREIASAINIFIIASSEYYNTRRETQVVPTVVGK